MNTPLIQPGPLSRFGGRGGLLALALLLVGLGGHGDSSRESTETVPSASQSRWAVPVPRVERDLPALEAEGILRVLLRNDSSSYYILRGEEHGFEYELARNIAEQLGLRLEVVLPDSQAAPLELLNRGDVDVVAAPLLPDAWEGMHVAFTRPYDRVRLVAAVDADLADSIRVPADLGGRTVVARRYSSGEARLFSARRAGIGVGIAMYPFDASVDEILDRVADGTYPAAVVFDRDLRVHHELDEGLVRAFAMSGPRWVRWAVRANAPELLAAVDAILQRHFRTRPDGSVARSEFYAVVHERYFGNRPRARRHADDPYRLARTGRVSPYDELFKAAAAEFDLDWRLLAALAFQESRFDPDAVSWAEAVGLMQVRPVFAGIDADSLRVPAVNVTYGARHLKRLLEAYSFLPERERLRFAIAAYNCGKGHLDDARMLSIRRGLDPNLWEGSVRESLLLLREPQYHRHARYGYVRGSQTVAYVRDVLERYEVFRRVLRERRPLTMQRVTWNPPTSAN